MYLPSAQLGVCKFHLELQEDTCLPLSCWSVLVFDGHLQKHMRAFLAEMVLGTDWLLCQGEPPTVTAAGTTRSNTPQIPHTLVMHGKEKLTTKIRVEISLRKLHCIPIETS